MNPMKNTNTNTNTNAENVPATIKSCFPAFELMNATSVKVLLTCDVTRITPEPIAFRASIVKAACEMFAADNTRRAAAARRRGTALEEKAATIAATIAARIPAPVAKMMKITVRGEEVEILESEYIDNLLTAAAECRTIADAFEMKSDKFDAAGREITGALKLDSAAAIVVRVYASSIFGGACTIKPEHCDNLAAAVKAIKAWNLSVADYVGPLDTTTEQWKALKNAVADFMRTFEVMEDTPAVKKTRLNWNAGELEYIATRVFAARNIMWTNTGDNKKPAFEMGVTDGRVRFEKELVNALVLKYSGKRISANVTTKGGANGTVKGGHVEKPANGGGLGLEK